MEGFENLFIDQFESPYPNFSALEFMTSQETLDAKGEAICKFLEVTGEMAAYAQSHPVEATSMYYDYTKEERSTLMDKIIEDTIPRLKTDIKADSEKWRELAGFLEELDVVKLTQEQYNSIWTA